LVCLGMLASLDMLFFIFLNLLLLLYCMFMSLS
jgi:hypothetical protein